MNITRRKFLGLIGLGIVSLLFGRFLNLFRPKGEKTARHWKRGDDLAG